MVHFQYIFPSILQQVQLQPCSEPKSQCSKGGQRARGTGSTGSMDGNIGKDLSMVYGCFLDGLLMVIWMFMDVGGCFGCVW